MIYQTKSLYYTPETINYTSIKIKISTINKKIRLK